MSNITNPSNLVGGSQIPPSPGGMGRQFTLSDTTSVACESCGCEIFNELVAIRRLSHLTTGHAEDDFVRVKLLTCANCGKIFSENLPDELKKLKTVHEAQEKL